MIEALERNNSYSRKFRTCVYEAVQSAPAPLTVREIAGYINYVEDTKYSTSGVAKVLKELIAEGVVIRREETERECMLRTNAYNTRHRATNLFWLADRSDGVVPPRNVGRLWHEVEPWDEYDPANIRYPRKTRSVKKAKPSRAEVVQPAPAPAPAPAPVHTVPMPTAVAATQPVMHVPTKSDTGMIVDSLIERLIEERTSSFVRDNQRLRNENAELRKEVARLSNQLQLVRARQPRVLDPADQRAIAVLAHAQEAGEIT